MTSRSATTPVGASPRVAVTVTRTVETGAPVSRTRAKPLSGSISCSTLCPPTRAAAAVAYTAAIAFVLMVPLRAFLGMYPRRRRQTDKGGELL